MENFRLEVQLKQITPHIHFQYRDAGVTLRATEVKPKLDRFLARQLQATGNPVPRQWLLPSQEGQSREYHFAYKLSITGRMETIQWKKTLMYFGNIGKNERDYTFLLARSPITMVFLCGIQDRQQRAQFMTFLKDHLQDFFLTHNFGSRQTKGYGGYLVEKIGGIPVQQDELVALSRYYSSFAYFTPDESNIQSVFSQIAEVYGDLRESLLAKYENNDKVAIRRWLKDGRPQPQCRFYRAVLGMTGNYYFPKQKISVRVSHGKIQRYPSPVLIKVLPDKVCLLPCKNASIANEKEPFTFRLKSGGFPLRLYAPRAFDLEAFLMDYAKDNGLGVKPYPPKGR